MRRYAIGDAVSAFDPDEVRTGNNPVYDFSRKPAYSLGILGELNFVSLRTVSQIRTEKSPLWPFDGALLVAQLFFPADLLRHNRGAGTGGGCAVGAPGS